VKWIDQIPFPVVVGSLAAALALGIVGSRVRFGLDGDAATLLIVGGLTGAYLLDYSRRPGPQRPPAPPPRPTRVGPVSIGAPGAPPRPARREPLEPILDDLSDEEDPVLEADRLASEPERKAPENPDSPDDTTESGG
jgi:hypothetical protein